MRAVVLVAAVAVLLAGCGGSSGGRSRQPLPIVIESPDPEATVTSPVRASGTANTFEATFTIELRGGGRTLAKMVVTATSGSGTRGTYSVSIPFTVTKETRGELVAYELSAENGRRINTVSVPLTLRP